jgi:hypothetical protein
MKTACSRILIITLLFSVFGCLEMDKEGFELFSETFEFNQSDFNWTAGFSDYPPADSTSYELKFAYTEEPSGTRQMSMMLSGNNHSDDLFMFIKKKVSGFRPSTEYTLTFDVEFATEAKEGSVGIGGSPGEGVFLKVGASAMEPKSVIDGNYYVMNIDKGNQSTSGQDMIMIGDIAAPASSSGYTLITRTNTTSNGMPLTVKSNSAGELWLIVGTDSGFEGITNIYYTKILVVFSASK